MAKINAINNKSGELTVDPGSSGDSFIQFDINTTGEWRIGVDDDDSDAFKISQGSALGSNDFFIMSANGERTMPSQPAFLAYVSSTATNQTGVTIATVPADTEVFDQGSDYNTGTYQFTAPVTGRYSFVCGVVITDITSANRGYLRWNTSNRVFSLDSVSPAATKTSTDLVGYSAGVTTDMDASDVAYLEIFCTGEASDVIDIVGGATLQSYFGGYLEC